MSTPYDIARAVGIRAEDFTRIERALASNRSMADLAKAIQGPLHTTALTQIANAFEQIAKSMQPPAYLTAASQMVVAMQREQELFAQIHRPPQLMAHLADQFGQMRALRESITAPYSKIQAAFDRQSTVLEALSLRGAAFEKMQIGIPQLSEMTLAWNVASIGLAHRMDEIGLLAQRESLAARLLETPNTYTAFVQHTMDRLKTDPAPAIAARLLGSLNLAEEQLVAIADAVSGFIRLPDDEDEPDATRVLNAPYWQQDELVSSEALGVDADTEAMTRMSPTAHNVQRGRRVLELVTLCNEAGKTSAYGVEIFKPTTRLMTVFNDLPWLASTDRTHFGELVDCLYFIFYEGAGKDNLRFLDTHGGPLAVTDCDLIWCIKHLRNKWSRHDADHGKEKDIQKSWAELAAKFRWLGLADHPTESQHFQHLHSQLLILAEDFLKRILSNLRLKQ